VVDYKALTGLSLPRVPHFHARHGASLKVLNPDTTSVSKIKCFLASRRNTRKDTNVGNPLELCVARVIYRVGQITHRAITKNKRGQVIVTMHASKLKMNTITKHLRTRTQSLINKGKDTKAHPSPRLLLELERMLDSTLDSRQGFTHATTTKSKHLQVENYG
jgi:hypothetical protein